MKYFIIIAIVAISLSFSLKSHAQIDPKTVVGAWLFDSDPKENPKAQLIPEITKDNLAQVLEKVGESKSIDVTNGMKGKLDKLTQTLNSVPALIFNLYTEKNLEKALKGEEIMATKIAF